MGDVYLVIDTFLGGERLALKVLHAHLCKDKRHATRFLREVQITRKVTHPNVIRTFDVGEFEGKYHFTMEYAEGAPLKTHIESLPLPIQKTITILRGICAGLGAIHEGGIIHRDLKPANVILLANGQVKIADFGVARLGWSSLTAEDEIVGSAPYLAPELWAKNSPSPTSDIYALGVMVYEMSTGILPLDADSPAQMMCKHLETAPVPPSHVEQSLPGWFDRFVLSLMQKDPHDRPNSVAKVLELLDQLESSSVEPAPSPLRDLPSMDNSMDDVAVAACELAPTAFVADVSTQEISAQEIARVREELSQVSRFPSSMSCALSRHEVAADVRLWPKLSTLLIRLGVVAIFGWIILGPLSRIVDSSWRNSTMGQGSLAVHWMLAVAAFLSTTLVLSLPYGAIAVVCQGTVHGSNVWWRVMAVQCCMGALLFFDNASYFDFSVRPLSWAMIDSQTIRSIIDLTLEHLAQVAMILPRVTWLENNPPSQGVQIIYYAIFAANIFGVVGLLRRSVVNGAEGMSILGVFGIPLFVAAPMLASSLAKAMNVTSALTVPGVQIFSLRLGATVCAFDTYSIACVVLSWGLLLWGLRIVRTPRGPGSSSPPN